MFWLYSGVPQKNMKEVTISVQTCFTNNTKQICKPRSQSRRYTITRHQGVHQGTPRNVTPGFVALLVAGRSHASLDVFSLQPCEKSSSNKPCHVAFVFYEQRKQWMTRPISLPWLAVKGVWCIPLICISIANDASNTREGLRSLSSNETGLQELAQASVSDGLQSQDIMELSGLGAFGSYANNCHRDLQGTDPTLSIQVPVPKLWLRGIYSTLGHSCSHGTRAARWKWMTWCEGLKESQRLTALLFHLLVSHHAASISSLR